MNIQMKESNSRIMALTVWLIASVFYAYQYILRVMPNIMLNDIMEQFDISAVTFGQFSGFYYLGYSLLHLPIGIMLDRYGPKRIMTGCILLTVAGMMPLIFAEHWAYPIIGRFFVGLGSSAAILGLFKIVRMTFSEKLFPRMLSFSVTIGLIGAIYGGIPISYMREAFGYQTVIELLAVMGLILAAITYCIVPGVKSESQGAPLSDVKEVLSNIKVILCCLFAGMMLGPLEGFADVWGTVFLKQVYGYESTIAAGLPSMIFIGMCFGSPVLSLVADKAKSYPATIIGSGIIMITCFGFLLCMQISSGILTLDFLLIGICCAYQILAIYQASMYVREQVAGLTTALANMIIMLFGYAFHSIIGGVVNALGGPDTSEALIYGVSVIPLGLFFGTCGFLGLFIWDKRSAQIKDQFFADTLS
jgi:predicted MFS family arabinose efflux permease